MDGIIFHKAGTQKYLNKGDDLHVISRLLSDNIWSSLHIHLTGERSLIWLWKGLHQACVGLPAVNKGAAQSSFIYDNIWYKDNI